MNMTRDLTIQDFLAVTVSLGVFALILCKYTVPDQIWSGWMVIITFFFNQPKTGMTTTVSTTEAPKTGV
jgi:hypothetical protein